MAKKEKFKSKTLQTFKRWKALKVGLYAGMFSAPILPATITTIINWDEWFAQAGVNLPFGFASLLVTTILGIVGIWKKDEIVSKAVSAIYYVALVFACLGATNLLLSSLFSTVGQMFLLTAGGLVASGTCDQVNRNLVTKRIEEYAELVEKNELDPRVKKKNERKERAKLQAEEEAKHLHAVE